MHPRGFFGRDSALRKIFQIWSREPVHHVVVSGRRCSGKTSLLQYLETIHRLPKEQLRPGQRADWLPEAPRYRFVFIDFQDERMRDAQGLVRRLGSGLGLPALEPADLSHFTDLLCKHLSEPAILLMDGIEAGFPSQPDFWACLRSLSETVSGGRLGFLIALQRDETSLSDGGLRWARFRSLFGYEIELGPLEETEALELIGSSPKPFPAEDVQWILRESGCHPALLQVLCDSRLQTLGCAESARWREEALRRTSQLRQLVE
jgi:hypothetical protein